MLIRILRTYLYPYRVKLTGVAVLQLVSVGSMLYLPSLNADLIDNGVIKGDVEYIMSTGFIMLLIAGLEVLASAFSGYLGAQAAMAMGRDLREVLVKHVSRFSVREIGNFGTSSLIVRTTNDVEQIQQVAVTSATMLLTAPAMCVGGIVMALHVAFGLSWVLLIAVPALATSLGFIVLRMLPGSQEVQRRIDEVNHVFREQILGMQTVRSFVQERREIRRFSVVNSALTGASLHVGRVMALMVPAVMLITDLAVVAVIWFGGRRVDDNVLQVGELTAMVYYLMHILAAVMMASLLVMMIPRAAASANRIRSVLEEEPSVVSPELPAPFRCDAATIEFSSAGFCLPGAIDPILKDVRFRVEPGTVTAIVGNTGSGKSTLINLIPRLSDVTEGAVYVGGTDVRNIELDSLRRVIGLVPQAPHLFSGTIATNLRYGNPTATDKDLWWALNIAQADDFVRSMPGKLDSFIAEGGVNISGGQRQRLTIARALVRRPRIYLFDDAFSALDVATEARLRDALVPVMEDSSVVIVSQRVSSILSVDQIVVLAGGEIRGVGTHEKLMRDCEEYKVIVSGQPCLDCVDQDWV